MNQPVLNTLRIAFLHTAPQCGNIRHNISQLEHLFSRSVELMPDLILTPELAISGYEFDQKVGHEWIRGESQKILERFSRLCQQYHTAMLLGCPTFDDAAGQFHNSAVFIDETGQIAGMHHKVLVLPGDIEGWSSPGKSIEPVTWRGTRIGLMICADVYQLELAKQLHCRGAQVLLSLAAWAPGLYAPSGEWEQCTLETGLCMFVCNRTGASETLDFTGSSSAVIVDGRRLLEYSQAEPAILLATVNFETWRPTSAAWTSIETIK